MGREAGGAGFVSGTGIAMTWMKVGTRRATAAAIVLVGLMAANHALAAQRTAMVVGNGAYAHVPTLSNP